jgi:hypothetical protein
MAYTASANKVKTQVPAQASLFSNLQMDGARNALTGVLGNRMNTRDATGTPQNSPLTVNTTATIVVPQNAAQIIICSVTNAVQVSEDSTQTSYFSLPAGVPWPFDVADQQNVYLKTSGSTVVSFYFTQI